jgi:hypothetical protein
LSQKLPLRPWAVSNHSRSVFQRDFGCCGALIGGESALKKVRPDPAGESVVSFASRAEPGSEIRLEEYDMAKRRMSTFERLNSGQMNRAQRRELGRRVAASDPGLTIVHANAGGIDVGNESHFVAVPPDRDVNPVREFGCWTRALNEMAEWLKSCRIDTVAMQATGVYWIAVVRHSRTTRHPGGTGERAAHQKCAGPEDRLCRNANG